MSDVKLDVWNVNENLAKYRTIMFYEDVNNKSAQYVNALINVMNNDDPSARITIHLNTPGGGAYDMLALADTISHLNAPVFVIVEGLAASAGAAVVAAADRAYIMPNAEIMIHQVQTGVKGSLPEIEDEISNSKRLTDKYLGFISKKTGLSLAELKKRTQKDWYLTAEEAIKLHIVDGYAPSFKDNSALEEAIKGFESDPAYIANNSVKKTSKKSK